MIPTHVREISIRNNQYTSLKGSVDQGRGSVRKEEESKGAEEEREEQEWKTQKRPTEEERDKGPRRQREKEEKKTRKKK